MEREFKGKLFLTGGVLFNLVLNAKRTVNVPSKNPIGPRLAVSEPELLEELMKIAIPDIIRPDSEGTMKQFTNKYKKGMASHSSWIPIHDDSVIQRFDRAIKERYRECLFRCMSYFEDFYGRKDEMYAVIGKLILQAIYDDPLIPDDAELYLDYSGKPITKSSLIDHKFFVFQSIVVGALHWIMTNRIQNDCQDLCSVLRNTPLSRLKEVFLKECSMLSVSVADYDSEEAKQLLILAESRTERMIRTKFANYMFKAYQWHSKVKTILNRGSEVDFKSIFVCSDLLMSRRSSRHKNAMDGEPSMAATGEGSVPTHASISQATPSKIRRFFVNKLIIQGAGGMGKSMMAKHLFLSAIDDFDREKQVPIFIQAKDYQYFNGSFDDFVFEHVTRYDDSAIPYIKKQDLIDAAKGGFLLFLFDGIDEVGSACRGSFISGLNQFQVQYKSCQFILTSRKERKDEFDGYKGFSVSDIMSLNLEQALELVDKSSFEGSPDLRNRFRAELEDHLYDTHWEFASTPLLLTIMLITYENYEHIPSKMHLFYKEAYESLSVKHDARKGYDRKMLTPLGHEAFTNLLECFCMITQYEEKYVFDEMLFTQYFIRAKELAGFGEQLYAKDFIDDLCDNVCLLYREGNRYSFVHRSFQEYFCASYFAKQPGEKLTEVGEEFEPREMNSGEVLQMVCDLRPEDAGTYIFLPFIEKTLGGGEDAVSFPLFMIECYSTIDAYTGNLVYAKKKAKPCSPTYRAIKHRLGFDDVVVDFLPIDQDFVVEAFAEIMDENGEASIHSFGEYHYPVTTVDGHVVDLEDTHSEIEMFELFGPASDHGCDEIIAALWNSQFGKEFNALLGFADVLRKEKEEFEKNQRFIKIFE